MAIIDTTGLEPCEVLAALYNSSKPLGLGFLTFKPTDMTIVTAKSCLAEGTYFDYLDGRIMKVDLKDPCGFDPRLYDRDNGDGAAQTAVNALRGHR